MHRAKCAAFTLVELLIGMSLSLMIMGAILSSYVFVGRSFARSFGVSSDNGASIESQGRLSLVYFAQDVRMAVGVTSVAVTPPDTLADTFSRAVKFVVPSESGTKVVLYYYTPSTSASRFLHSNDAIDDTFDSTSIEFRPGTLTRVVLSTPRTTQALHSSLLTCSFKYYDTGSQPYTVFDPAIVGFSSLSGIRQIALEITAQTGKSENGTLSQIYRVASPRLILPNTQLQR